MTDQTQTEPSFEEAFAEAAKAADARHGQTHVAAPPPADEGQESEPPAAEAQPPADQEAAPAAPAADPWANIDPAIKKQYDDALEARRQLEHRFVSEQGRITAAQKILAAHDKTATTAAPSPTAADIAAAAASSPKLAALRADYPELAEAIEEVVLSMATQQQNVVKSLDDRLKQSTQPLLEQHARTEEERAEAAVRAAHPNFDKDLREPDFMPWLSKQRPAIRTMFDSADPADAIAMLDLYRKDHPAQTAPAAPAQSQTTTPAALAAPSKQDRLARAAERPNGRQPAAQPIAEDDFEGAYKVFANRVNQRLAQHQL